MNKSPNIQRPIYWGWEGIYDYSELRTYYKRVVEEEIGEELEELALVGQRQSQEA
jgi:hypothetical protein